MHGTRHHFEGRLPAACILVRDTVELCRHLKDGSGRRTLVVVVDIQNQRRPAPRVHTHLGRRAQAVDARRRIRLVEQRQGRHREILA
ncbi:uncharacterized protein SPSK_04735 [Sporothrix schenckii 1099-18]|uniref:Uncharacterized protein n=1 Tax=Sporothrix schenckii 1099-18 TaxID=1397361 RepID=A0A0F2M0L0_SPOSC|nr:uncharacterized protein SPSK_04735 [Sporothrix schenckii 1099-18]KJR83237.1 hypothetical protein SPSK_04735 [Sporothrix schenckii 1099-18]